MGNGRQGAHSRRWLTMMFPQENDMEHIMDAGLGW